MKVLSWLLITGATVAALAVALHFHSVTGGFFVGVAECIALDVWGAFHD